MPTDRIERLEAVAEAAKRMKGQLVHPAYAVYFDTEKDMMDFCEALTNLNAEPSLTAYAPKREAEIALSIRIQTRPLYYGRGWSDWRRLSTRQGCAYSLTATWSGYLPTAS